MNLTEHTALLTSKLRDLASKFTAPDDLEDLIAESVKMFSRHRPRIFKGSVSLVAGTASYAVTGLTGILTSPWGRTTGKPWEDSPGTPPSYSVLSGQIVFDTAPTAFDIATWGAEFKFTGRALHTIDASSTVPEEDEPLITLYAQFAALSDLANDQAGKSTGHKVGTGYGLTRDTTLAARAEKLGQRWERLMGIEPGTVIRAAGGRS